MQESSVGPALSMNFDMRKDVRGVFMAKKETLLSLANVHAVNERGQSSVDIDRINHHIVNVEKINFRLPERRSRFATIHGKMEPYLGTMLLQSTTKRRNITSNSVINSG